MNESSFQYVNPLASLVTIDILIVEMFLICHVTLLEYTFKGLCKYMGGSPLQ